MDWGITLIATFVVLIVFGPALVLAVSLVGLAVLGHVMPPPARIATATFDCPYRHRHVTAEFATSSASLHPTDVLACSAFADPRRVGCRKGCLALADTRWALPAVTPRYSLVSGGVVTT